RRARGTGSSEFHALVVVGVEAKQGYHPADIRPHELDRPDVVALGVLLLGEDDHLVPLPAPLARELPRVDVRAGSREKVAGPGEDLHGTTKPVVSIISGIVTNS